MSKLATFVQVTAAASFITSWSMKQPPEVVFRRKGREVRVRLWRPWEGYANNAFFSFSDWFYLPTGVCTFVICSMTCDSIECVVRKNGKE